MFLERNLKKLCPNGVIRKNIALKNYSTIRIGGRAAFMVMPRTIIELKHIVDFLSKKHKKYFVLGNGSNVLFRDGRYRGVIIKLSLLNKIEKHGNFVHAQAGANLSSLVKFAFESGLEGVEEAIGIPGTIGGAVVMNASAYGYETRSVLQGIHVLRNGKIKYLKTKECGLGYRSSALANDIVISADFRLKAGDKDAIKARMNRIIEKRSHLPQQPSLGSVFKRTNGIAVSKLIDELNMKGTKRGGAMISLQHAGVIVNNNNAKAKHVKKLIKYIKKRCFHEKNIILDEEIKIL